MEVILRCSAGGLEWSVAVVDNVPVALLVGLARLRRINDSVLEGSGWWGVRSVQVQIR
jgi:hypothetical protein